MPSDYDQVSTSVGDLIGRFSKAISASVAAGTSTFASVLASDGNYKTAAVAAVLAVVGGFGFVAASPKNREKVDKPPARGKGFDRSA